MAVLVMSVFILLWQQFMLLYTGCFWPRSKADQTGDRKGLAVRLVVSTKAVSMSNQ